MVRGSTRIRRGRLTLSEPKEKKRRTYAGEEVASPIYRDDLPSSRRPAAFNPSSTPPPALSVNSNGYITGISFLSDRGTLPSVRSVARVVRDFPALIIPSTTGSADHPPRCPSFIDHRGFHWNDVLNSRQKTTCIFVENRKRAVIFASFPCTLDLANI